MARVSNALAPKGKIAARTSKVDLRVRMRIIIIPRRALRMRIIIIPTGRVRMRIIIKIVQMYQKVRSGAKSTIYRILASPKFFRSIPFSRKSQYHFPAGAYTVFSQVLIPLAYKSKIILH